MTFLLAGDKARSLARSRGFRESAAGADMAARGKQPLDDADDALSNQSGEGG